jgi:hypothetical protein
MFACSRPTAGRRGLRRNGCRLGPGQRAASRPRPRASRVEESSARLLPRGGRDRRYRGHPGALPNDRCPSARRDGLDHRCPPRSYDRRRDPRRSASRCQIGRRADRAPHPHRCRNGRRADRAPHSHRCRNAAPDARSRRLRATPFDPDSRFRAGPDARPNGSRPTAARYARARSRRAPFRVPRARRIARACPALRRDEVCAADLPQRVLSSGERHRIGRKTR